MNILNFLDGVYPVRHPESEGVFSLSIMWDEMKCLRGVKAFKRGGRRPARRNHLLRTETVRTWLDELELVDEEDVDTNSTTHARS